MSIAGHEANLTITLSQFGYYLLVFIKQDEVVRRLTNQLMASAKSLGVTSLARSSGIIEMFEARISSISISAQLLPQLLAARSHSLASLQTEYPSESDLRVFQEDDYVSSHSQPQ
ncbi:MAG: hypothetical protein U0930_06650 [Pirellulales bacterium]